MATAQGRRVKTSRVETTGPAAALVLTPDRATLRADGEDCALVTVSARDSEGRQVPTASDVVEFELSGPGKIIGVGNGDPACHEPDKGTPPQSLQWLRRRSSSSPPSPPGPLTLTARAPAVVPPPQRSPSRPPPSPRRAMMNLPCDSSTRG